MGDTQLAIPDDASKILRDKLRALFLEMLPDDQLDEAIQKEWDAFFDEDTPPTMSWGWPAVADSPHYKRKAVNDDRKDVSPFKHLVRSILLELAEKEIRNRLDNEVSVFGPYPDSRKDELLAAIVSKAAPELIEAVTEKIVEAAVQRVADVVRGGQY